MNLIKRHKGLALIGGLSLILLIIIVIIFSRMIFGSSNSTYGERLNNLIKLDSSISQKLTTEIKELDEVVDVSLRVQGKIIYITIEYQQGTKASKAKEIATKTLDYYDEEIKNYYDFGYFLIENISEETKSDEEDDVSGFVIAGTKHPDNDTISWTKE